MVSSKNLINSRVDEWRNASASLTYLAFPPPYSVESFSKSLHRNISSAGHDGIESKENVKVNLLNTGKNKGV